MKYENVVKGIFKSRPNRFIAKVEIDGKEETVHVKNTGRCRELLQSDVTVYLEKSSNPNRKTAYDLIAVEKIRENKNNLLVNMDSQVPNVIAYNWLKGENPLFSENAKIRREVTFGDSRFDLYVEDDELKAFVEVKGVTLEFDGYALFPDAPTERGVKHIKELVKAKEAGYEAYILFVIQMKEVHSFSPHKEMHPDFAEALLDAYNKGVKVLGMDCVVTPDSISIDKEVAVIL
ncbi:MAG: DNA/RNA nuclease SfsA [Ruminococcaceae bacterium]|nr:DNA/RNA nuclease SfsA [Oscillospiraceae bacterium]